MATTPNGGSNSPPGFTPSFKRVPQSTDFDCAFACIATITGKTIAEVRQIAIEKFKHPTHGPYWITQELINWLLADFGWGSTLYKEVSTIAELPDVAMLMVDYNATTEIGRHVVFHRQRGAPGKPCPEYIIDPATWIETAKHVRLDVKGLPASWYIGCTPMKAK